MVPDIQASYRIIKAGLHTTPLYKDIIGQIKGDPDNFRATWEKLLLLVSSSGFGPTPSPSQTLACTLDIS